MLFKNREEIVDNSCNSEIKNIRKDILDILEFAVKAVDPYKSIKKCFIEKRLIINAENFDLSTFNNLYLVGFGKASIGMAQAVCDSSKVTQGAVVTNDGNNKINDVNVETFIGGHPLPDSGSILGTEKILEIVDKCNKNDVLIVLISGGGSALLAKPRVSLKDLQEVTKLLLRSGADINEINTIRKHLSYVKGGQLVSKSKCLVISLIISDIIGDPIDFIASGPTHPDSTTFEDSKRILDKYNLWEKIPSSVSEIISDGIKNRIDETPKKDNIVFKNVNNFIVANNEIACKAAEKKAQNLGYDTMLLTTCLDGEAKDKSIFLVSKALNYKKPGKNIIFISGGETTVTIHGEGKGGRNQEMVLAAVKKMDKNDVVFASFATDGIDGMSDAAGAIADACSYARAKKIDLDPDVFLEDNNSYEFFKNLDDLFFTGPTGTNVMDLQLIVKLK